MTKGTTMNQRGFTLIELIVVIIILAIVSAIALPKFLNMQREARIAQLNAMAGSIKAAALLVRGKAEATNADLTSTTATLAINAYGVTTVDLDYGYPDATSTGIQGVVKAGSEWTITGSNPIIFQWGTFTNCNVSYTAPAAAGSRPTITITDSGCS